LTKTASFSEPPPPQLNLIASDLEEQVKVIGPLRIDISLYNVFLNEADEWSRRLLTELSEWALELHRPISESTVGMARSLADSAATVGFKTLSEMARSLEQAL
jgi:chemosensory pili system protein ChpA (sensor histidine kinase/response regulator)